jgi:spermidine synthase
VNANGIRRAYATALLHAAPEDVLEIGLASASGTAAILSDPRVRRLTTVELNPAYLEVIRHYPVQAAALRDPRLDLVIDDGRRWLRRHPGRRFDVIAMNSMVYWRSLATTLLSREFLEICREHLKPGGVLYYNATGFEGSLHTAARVFRHVTRVENFVAASDAPIGVGPEVRREILLSLRMGDAPVFDPRSPALRAALEATLAYDLPELGPAYRARHDLPFITDDNMAPEFKAAPPLLPQLVAPHQSWSALRERRRAEAPPPCRSP